MMAARADAGGRRPARGRLQRGPGAGSSPRRSAGIAILDWEGVGDIDGNPVEPSPEGIGALLDLYPVFERFQLDYIAKGLVLELEKNVCAPSPNGTSAGATDIAPPARTDAPNAPSA